MKTHTVTVGGGAAGLVLARRPGERLVHLGLYRKHLLVVRGFVEGMVPIPPDDQSILAKYEGLWITPVLAIRVPGVTTAPCD